VGKIVVSGQNMQEAYTKLVGASQAIDAELAALDREVATLRSAWSGDATDAYDLAQQRWSAQLSRIQALLDDYNKRLERINGHYKTASHSVGNSIWK
jgi:WXG100 family type VII secretion target